VAISGELSQSERNHALQALRDGRARVCVATDVAARAIDLPNLALVIHADLPNDASVLQHRSGRTGRAGKKGISVLLVPPSRRRRVEEMLGKARVTASWGEAPSAAAIRKLDQERLLDTTALTEAASDDDLAMADQLLQSRDARIIAAAFVKIYRAGLPAPEDIDEDVPFPKRELREIKSRDHKERGNRDFGQKAREHGRKAPREDAARAPRDGDMQNGVWFRLNVGRERNADPKWLLPEICRQGELTKKDIGAIRVFEMETLFQVAAEVAPKFATLVSERKKGGVRISPALDQSGESSARPRTAQASGTARGDAQIRKPGFHGKQPGDNSGKKKSWLKKSRQKRPGKKTPA
jgi:ATP-dependent RNA helicase DeaD